MKFSIIRNVRIFVLVFLFNFSQIFGSSLSFIFFYFRGGHICFKNYARHKNMAVLIDSYRQGLK